MKHYDWQLVDEKIPIADTGDFERCIHIKIHGSNGGDCIAENWNPEDHEVEDFKRIVHEHNQHPMLVAALYRAQDSIHRRLCGNVSHHPACKDAFEALRAARFGDDFTPAWNDGQSVFVFGSNLAGRHGAGAALEAKRHWGAVNGVGVGRTGQAYAIPTKDEHIVTMPLAGINLYVHIFLKYAADLPDTTFLVTRIGCGLAGYTENQISPMFATAPANCILPNGWRK